jgi:hypothetical protein
LAFVEEQPAELPPAHSRTLKPPHYSELSEK